MQAAIQGDAVRVTGAKRDDLQAAMALMRKEIADAAAVLQQLPRLSARRFMRAAALALLVGCLVAAGSPRSAGLLPAAATRRVACSAAWATRRCW